jgi:hypothetical protein
MTGSDFKLIAIGSNELLAKELADAIRLILGEHMQVTACLSKDLTKEVIGDLYVCNKSQVHTLLKLIPIEKILILNLTPTTQFFVDLTKVPAGEKVYIFNNRLEYARQLIELCMEMSIKQVRFVPIAYEEMDRNIVTSLLAEARYIVGVDRLLGKEVLFSDPYKEFLRPDLTVIGAKRVAAIQSACALVKWFFLRMQKDISSKVSFLTESINETMQTQGIFNPKEKLNEMADEIKELAGENSKIAEAMQNLIVQSIMTQFNVKHKDVNGSLPNNDGTMQDIQVLIGKLKEFGQPS